MQNKRIFVSTLLIFLIMSAFSFSVNAQENRFKQSLEWVADPNAFEYKLEIKGVSDSSVSKVITTKDSSVSFSMAPGEYQYRVTAYDFLGREASASEWKNFTITKALKPKVNLKDTSVTVDGKNRQPVEIPVDVESITSESTLTFVNKETGEKIIGKLNTTVNEDGTFSSDSVVFPNVSVGEWIMVVTNPSGLSTESEPVYITPSGKKIIISKSSEVVEEPPVEKVEKKEPVKEKEIEVAEVPPEEEKEIEVAEVPPEEEKEIEEEKKEKKPYQIQDITFSSAFVTNFTLGDEYFASLNNNDFNYGVSLRLAWLPIDIKKVQLGFEASYTNTFIVYKNTEVFLTIPLNIWQISVVSRFNFLNGKIGLNAKAGGGVTIFRRKVHYRNPDYKEYEYNRYGYPSVSGGISFDWIPFKHLIAEIGADLNYTIMPDVNAITVIPYAAVGVRF